MMQMTDVTAHLAIGLRDPQAVHTEQYRALREGSQELEAVERRLSRAAGHSFDWGPTKFKDMYRGKSGRGGGVKATPTLLAFYLVGYLMDCRRREVAEQALTFMFAVAREQTLTGEATVCAKTKQRLFGAALVTLLSNRSLFDQVYDFAASSTLGRAHIRYLDGTETYFYTPAFEVAPSGKYTAMHLHPFIIAPVFDAIQVQPQSARQRAASPA
jgi:hypothetical protein